MNFEISDLRAFVAAADLGGFRAAADSLHLSASALSRRIEKLEDALGVRLFERTTRKMDLTIVGRGFLDRAYLILNEIDNSMLEVDDFARNMTGELTIACVPSRQGGRIPGFRRQLVCERDRTVCGWRSGTGLMQGAPAKRVVGMSRWCAGTASRRARPWQAPPRCASTACACGRSEPDIANRPLKYPSTGLGRFPQMA